MTSLRPAPRTSRVPRGRRALRRRVLSAAAAVLAGLPAVATWSIVATDSATGEVAVAGATCIENFHLPGVIAILAVGEGAGAGQAVPSSIRNAFIGRRLQEGGAPAEILMQALNGDGGAIIRQYGIVNLSDPPVTYSGSSTSEANPGVAGQAGTLRYAIQGNVLAGDAVVFEAERTLIESQGDLGQRVMAAMQTARMYGGDGRCSCNVLPPTACGSPPPSFTHSAYTSFILLARIGDDDGTCPAPGTCSDKSYYLDRRYVGDASDIDPIEGLQMRYDGWRANHVGVVDHLRTEVAPAAPRLVADGTSTVDVRVTLRDVNGDALATGGQTLHVRGIGGPQPASVAAVVDHGDGTHTVTLRATTGAGSCHWRIVVDDGSGDPKTLHPPLELDVDPLAPLHAGFREVSAAASPEVPLVVNAGAAQAGRAYIVLASASGTSPGTPFHGQVLPLNEDRLLRFTLTTPGPPRFPGSTGQLDGSGRAEARLRLSAASLGHFIGQRFDFAAVLFGSPDDFTNTVGFEIAP